MGVWLSQVWSFSPRKRDLSCVSVVTRKRQDKELHTAGSRLVVEQVWVRPYHWSKLGLVVERFTTVAD